MIKLRDLQRKELVNISDGTKIGYADDVVIDDDNATVKSLVVYGRLRLFGILGRQPDIVIRWENIEIIGEDAILVSVENLPRETIRRSKIRELFEE